jgi:mRNA interferase RelE/StbE
LIWRVEFDPDAFEELRSQDREAQRRILRYLRERIATGADPRRFGKALRGELAGLWRYRVGDYRLVCQIRQTILLVLVVRVAHRSTVYE